ncbi:MULTISPECIES: PucR family transcriptional regulator [unclassified Dehalobacter]|uniref:PucR family transcriptional regulator n=2 Tax=Dehalobacter TaxID=56112 RepID=UPI00037F3635|nr:MULTISPECIES: PucR family transcriptional regulator [unclassified Dehalobacter]RJE48811.1 hypothetical protein A7K50_08645 [Dehalobacter sp. MCB1]TCX51903.1 PucR family transcriptional regulator [Dehalobacter sp. 14DCB1]TCX52963.1 PucR family transcriptional regulator [Dehalobacter sp. 12DCB1]
MKLNIWMLAQWLKEYDPILTVTSGADEIEGMQFLSSFAPKGRRHIYIGRAKDFLSGNTSEEVLLTHGNDVISLRSLDMDEISSRIIDCFEFYNNWESMVFESAQLEHPEQRIVDACNNLIGPILIVDLKLNLIAYSKNYKPGEINQFWDEYIQLNKSSLKSIHLMNSSNSIKLIPVRHNRLVYEEPVAAPYSYGIMVSYCDKDNNLIGQCVLCMNHPITPRELCLAKTIEAALASIAQNTTGNTFINFAQSIVFEALSSGSLAEHNQKKLIALMDWDEDVSYQVTVCKINGAPTNGSLMTYLSGLSECFKKAIGLIFQEQLVFCHQAEAFAEHQLLSTIPGEIPLFVGVSAQFVNLGEVAIYHRQASIAVKRGFEQNKSLTHFRDCAIDVLVFESDRDFCRHCVHPGVRYLKDYDDQSGTSYSLTLRNYLQSERSYLLTAQQLFIHRNTAVYRLEKINELYRFNLDDPEEREYILFSFRLLGC